MKTKEKIGVFTGRLPIVRDNYIQQWSRRCMSNGYHTRRLTRPQKQRHYQICHLKQKKKTGQRKERTMNSTTLIPKCSSTIVLIPILARDSQLSIRGYEAFTTNSTCCCLLFVQKTGSLLYINIYIIAPQF